MDEKELNKSDDRLYQLALKEIQDNLEAIKGRADMEAFEISYQRAIKAEALIELLEIFNCGSTGGFDEGQTLRKRRRLKNRFQWLKKKVKES